MREYVSILKRYLLDAYKEHFNKLSIGSGLTGTIQKEHLAAAHVYLKVLTYYMYAEERGNVAKISITELDAEKMIFELKKSLQLSKIAYYE